MLFICGNNMLIFHILMLVVLRAHEAISAVEGSEWIGNIFPDSNNISEISPGEDGKENADLDHHGRIQMGVKNEHCDWGEDPHGFDGDLGPLSYQCFNDKSSFRSNPSVHPILHEEHIPKNYEPWHHCMNESISYKKVVPTYGDHRPLWPRYGEYSFLPKQRWLHSLEHGSIVMLYHPCADLNEVRILKTILKGCLYQYIISALNELDSERPIALVSWGASLHMSKVHPHTVIDFIRNRFFKAPEKVTDDGQYDKNLIEAALIQLKGEEQNICPNILM